jgi:asparagine synthase (glutamine-hydrolysing)
VCGFFGFVDFAGNTSAADHSEVKSGAQRIQHRGPDSNGFFHDKNFVISFNRLSIIDLEAPSQPFTNPESGITTACNGEIYNYRELREDLKRAGYSFATATDSEVILHGFEEWGQSLWERLNGIFSVVVWNAKKSELTLARDQLGVKPLHYMQVGNRVYFGSDYNSFFEQTYASIGFNQSALLSYLSFRYVVGAKTFYDKILDISPGSYRLSSPDQSYNKVYWDIPTDIDDSDKGEDYYLSRLDYLLNQAVTRQMMSDVPLGAFISGGLDSSALIYFMSKTNLNIKSYIAGFDVKGYNEFEYADEVAQHFNISPTKIHIDPDRFFELTEDVIHYRGEPPSIPHEAAFLEMSRQMKKDITVVLSGEGADELFGGYGRIFRSPQDYYRSKFVGKGFPSMMSHFLSRYSWFNQSDKDALLNPDLLKDGYFDEHSREYLSGIFSKYNEREYFRAMYYVQGKLHLPNLLTRLDRMTMAHSIEARVPFLDVDLVEFVSRMPLHYKLRWNSLLNRLQGLFQHSNQISENLDTPKYILKKLMTGRLPETIIKRKKMGFPVPLDNWLSNPRFRDLAADVLLDSSSAVKDYLNVPNLKKILSQKSINSYYDYEGKRIWMLINLELWHRSYFKR